MWRCFVWGAAACVLGLAGCASGRGHPVRLSQPRLEADESPEPPRGLPEPAVPDARAAEDILLQGLRGMWRHVRRLRDETASGRTPRLRTLRDVEAAVVQRYRGGGPNGPVNNVVVLGATGTVPIPPARMADLMGDPDVERQVLAAQTFRLLRTQFVVAGHSRREFYVEKLNVGSGPFRYNLRFAIAAERFDLPDGRVLLRYDPLGDPRPQGVTLYRGVALIEPEGDGARVTEVTVFGTDIRAPAPIWNLLRPLVDKTLQDRATNLWIRAHRLGPAGASR